MSMILVGVMGPGEGATERDCQLAFELGERIARQGWILITGGRRAGVMDAASRGAKAAHGLVVGILPGADDSDMSPAVDIPIITGLHEARNNINVLSSRVLFFAGMSPGTAAELALALKCRRHVVLVCPREDVVRVFAEMSEVPLAVAADVEDAVALAGRLLAENQDPLSS